MFDRQAIDIKKRYLQRNILLQKYIFEVNNLLSFETTQSNLLSIEDTDIIRDKAKLLRNKPKSYARMLFSNKRKLKEYINELKQLEDGELLMLITDSYYCGAVRVPSLSDFNYNFEFSAEHCGIVSFIRSDISNELLIDFYEQGGEQFIEVEAFGDTWSKVVIS